MGATNDLAHSPDLARALNDLGSQDAMVPIVVNQVAGVTVSTLAGSSVAGVLEGTGASAQFDNPVGIALDNSGTLYVTEYDGSRIRRVTPAGVTSGLTFQPGFVGPFGVVLNDAGDLVVQTDYDATGTKTDSSGTLWKVPINTGVATVILGGLGRPRSLAALSASNIVVADRTRNTISSLDPASAQLTPMDSPSLDAPLGVAVLPDGSVVVSESGHNCLRRIVGNVVSVFAGDGAGGTSGMVDGPAAAARFNRPVALSVDTLGNVYVSDQGNSRIRRVDVDGTVETIAGNGIAGFADGAGGQAEFYGQEGLAVLPAGGIGLPTSQANAAAAALPPRSPDHASLERSEIGGGSGRSAIRGRSNVKTQPLPGRSRTLIVATIRFGRLEADGQAQPEAAPIGASLLERPE